MDSKTSPPDASIASGPAASGPAASGPADAITDNWVMRYAPAFIAAYLQLSRWDRPIGTWLLLWPCWWSTVLATRPDEAPNLGLLILFGIGALAMRGAGCTWNDIIDRKIDAEVARTAGRPLPSGRVSVKKAFLWLCFQAFVGLAVLLSLPTYAIAVGLASLVPVAVYPFMKRITYWPQAVLGIAFNWGALMGFAAVRQDLPLAALALYLGAIAWTLGYDTIYAHQDADDDAIVGVKSTALKFGESSPLWIGVFYGLFIAGLVATGLLAKVGLLYYPALAIVAAHLIWQVRQLDINDGAQCLRLFRSNHMTGWLVFMASLAGLL